MPGIASLFITTYRCNDTCCSCNLETGSWILDSRASDHMSFDVKPPYDLNLLERPVLASLPNGYKVQVTHHGKLRINDDLIFNHLLLVPHFKYNLLFVRRLTSQLHCQVILLTLEYKTQEGGELCSCLIFANSQIG